MIVVKLLCLQVIKIFRRSELHQFIIRGLSSAFLFEAGRKGSSSDLAGISVYLSSSGNFCFLFHCLSFSPRSPILLAYVRPAGLVPSGPASASLSPGLLLNSLCQAELSDSSVLSLLHFLASLMVHPVSHVSIDI